jgi:hypothetical protein
VIRRLAFALLTVAVGLSACGQREAKRSDAPTVLERPVFTLVLPPTADGAVRVPNAALIARAGQPGVFVLTQTDGATTARFRLVSAGKVRGQETDILSGLAGNETLVLGDLSAVHDGSVIQAKR